MNVWRRPAGTAGDIALVRASNTAVREDVRDCPTAWGAKLRPLLMPDPPSPQRPKLIEDFPLGPFMDCLDLIEHRNWPRDRVFSKLWSTRGNLTRRRAPVHPSHLQWTASAVELYLAARESQQNSPDGSASPPTVPLRDAEWVVVPQRPRSEADARGATRYELSAWGRRYVSADGAIRDLWLPSTGGAKEHRSEAEKAALAYVLVRGMACPRPGYRQPYEPLRHQPHPPPERVRVFEFGCTTGDTGPGPLLDWDRQEAERQYAEHAAPAFARVVEGADVTPGSSCVECKAISGCAALKRTPHLWGEVHSRARQPRRSLSVSDLRAYSDCPAKYHLTRRLHLKAAGAESDAVIRGRAVDARLNEQPLLRPARGCREIDGPATLQWSSGGFDLAGELAREAAAMLAQHTAICPLDGLGQMEQVKVQHQLTAYIPELDIVVVAKPDLLYTRSGGWILRESKTTSGRLWEGKTLMSGYPQLALGVLLLAAGVLEGNLKRSRVELELLYVDGANLESLDPSQPAVVDEAREVIAHMAAPLLGDGTYEPVTGRHCHGCEAITWCRPGAEYVAENPAPPPSAASSGSSKD